LQALEGLAVAGGLRERLATLEKLDLLALEVLPGGLVGALGALQVRLVGHEVVGARGQTGGVHLGSARPRDALGSGLDLLLAPAVAHHRAGELLLGGVLTTLAQGANSLEAEAERGSVHGPLLDRVPEALSDPGHLS